MSEPKRLMPETLEENLRFVAAALGLGAADEIRGHIAALENENRALVQRAEQAERERDTWKHLYETGKGWASAEDLSKAQEERDAARQEAYDLRKQVERLSKVGAQHEREKGEYRETALRASTQFLREMQRADRLNDALDAAQTILGTYRRICMDALDGAVAGTPEDAARLAREYAETRQEGERLTNQIRLDVEHDAILLRDLGAEEAETLRGAAMRHKQEVETLRARVAELEAFVATAHSHTAWESLKAAHAKALIRARNEGLEKAARLVEDAATTCTCRARHYSNCSCHWSERLDKAGDDIRAKMEPE